jgi:hypothetical protein
MKEVEVDTLDGYLKLIKESKDEHINGGDLTEFVFRGQTADFPLIPKLCRLKAKGDLLHIEQLLLQEFKRNNPLLIEQTLPLNDWDYLALGQHFGLPTRLLDWSNNALTALWFATALQDCELVQDYAVVWILMASDEDFELGIEQIHPFDVPQTKIVRPRIIKQRINNQSGVFTILSSAEINEQRYMEQSDSFKKKLIKVKIPVVKFADIRTDLNTLGVNAFSIYPELEGLCAYLQWRYFE